MLVIDQYSIQRIVVIISADDSIIPQRLDKRTDTNMYSYLYFRVQLHAQILVVLYLYEQKQISSTVLCNILCRMILPQKHMRMINSIEMLHSSSHISLSFTFIRKHT